MHNYKPADSSYPEFYKNYMDTLEDLPLLEVLENELDYAMSFFKQIPIDKINYSYAPDKWTVKQVLLHMIDTEKVFSYRALCLGRGETQGLLGFDQDVYMAGLDANQSDFQDLIQCLFHLRKSNILLFKTFRPEDMMRRGSASGMETSCLAVAYLTAGHTRYHINILKERYDL